MTAVIRVNGWTEASNYLRYRVGFSNPHGSLSDYFGMRSLKIPFEFGQPVNIETIVSASAYVWDGSGQATADFGHTFRWTGVESIVDANGQAITDYTLTAASGADYVNPVPEPASMAALAIGAGGILRRRRKA
jgi:hypothetical protein